MTGILLTGATGDLGMDMVRSHLKSGSSEPLYLVLRGSDHEVKAKLNSIIRYCGERKLKNLLLPVKGDILLPGMGLSRKQTSIISSKITGAIHCAADVNFSTGLLDSLETNFEGTRNLLVFLMKCKKLEKIGYVSTLFIAGKRKGRILENELEHSKGFVNPYEKTKYETERLLCGLRESLPIAIYRPAIIFSDSSGRIRKFNAVHKALQFYYHDMIRYLPGRKDTRVNLVTSDFVSESIISLFGKFRPETYHVCSTDKNSFTLMEMLEEARHHFIKYMPAWRSKRIRIPKILPKAEYESVEREAESNGDKFSLQILRSLKTFTLQMAYPKTYDTSNFSAVLGSNWNAPHPREYFEKSIAFSIKMNWSQNG